MTNVRYNGKLKNVVVFNDKKRGFWHDSGYSYRLS